MAGSPSASRKWGLAIPVRIGLIRAGTPIFFAGAAKKGFPLLSLRVDFVASIFITGT